MKPLNTFKALLAAHSWPESFKERLDCYFHKVLEENQLQNLTRLTSPEDFYKGHVLDTEHLLKSQLLEPKVVDMGSGLGVPGLIAAILEPKRDWLLSESEKRKAEFLKKVVDALDLKNCSVTELRAEEALKSKNYPQIVARAVGKIDKIYFHLEACSTWNSLVLMKGPSWEAEWNGFNQKHRKNTLQITNQYKYKIDENSQERVIVLLRRVPRGT